MPKLIYFLLLSFIFSLSSAPSALAAQIATESATVTAAVPAAITSTDNLAPTAPLLLRPTDGHQTNDSTPELVWRQSTDPDGNTIYYDLYLDGIATFLGVSNTGNSSALGLPARAGYTTTIYDNEVRLIPTSPLSDGTHNWFVRAYDLVGAYANSTVWNFRLDTTPPFFVITDLDTHHGLSLDSRDASSVREGTSFEVTGPKDIYFTIASEPYTTLTLSFYNSSGSLLAQTSASTAHSSLVYPYVHLPVGTYSVQVVAADRVNLTAAIPTFDLIVSQAAFVFPPPPASPSSLEPLPSPLITIPYSPLALPSLPASIALITTRGGLPILLASTLALAILILLILLRRRRCNLILLNSQGTPLKHATVYHSHPDTHPSTVHGLRSSVLLTPRARGRLYLPHLARYSTLTIVASDAPTLSLCLSRYHPPLTLMV